MAAIVGYLGNEPAYPIIKKGLSKMEYYPYDSVGIGLISKTEIAVSKIAGRLKRLNQFNDSVANQVRTGIGQMRWTRIGAANNQNAQPLLGESGRITIVHDGFVENHEALKEELIARGHLFTTGTDSEVILKLIEDILFHDQCELEQAVCQALTHVEGSYSVLASSRKNPDKIVAAKRGMPLCIGKTKDSFVVGNNVFRLLDSFVSLHFLEDEEVATLYRNGDWKKQKVNDTAPTKTSQGIAVGLKVRGDEEKKSIYSAISRFERLWVGNCLRGRVDADKKKFKLPEVDRNATDFKNANKIVLIGNGSSYRAAKMGAEWMEAFSGKAVEVRKPKEVLTDGSVCVHQDVFVAISGSGEDASTIEATKWVKSRGGVTLGLVNVPGSSLSKICATSMYTRCGKQEDPLSLELFGSQLIGLYMIASEVGKQCGTLNEEDYQVKVQEIANLNGLFGKRTEVSKRVSQWPLMIERFENLALVGNKTIQPLLEQVSIQLNRITQFYCRSLDINDYSRKGIDAVQQDMACILVNDENSFEGELFDQLVKLRIRGSYVVTMYPSSYGSVNSDSSEKDVQNLIDLKSSLLTLLSFHILMFELPTNRKKSITALQASA